MKKLMFVAVAVASCAAFASADLPVEDEAVFGLTFSQKTIEAKYGEGEVMSTVDPDVGFDYYATTKEEAEADAKAKADIIEEDDCIIKSISVKSKRIEGEKLWGYEIKYAELDKDTIKSSKVVTTTLNGLCYDGRVFVWDKADKETEGYNKGLVHAYEVTDEFDLQGQAVAKKAVAGFTWGENLNGAGTGTAAKDDDGDYTLVKSVSGSIVGKIEDDECDFNNLYGTWKFQKDASATKLLKKDYSVEDILWSKGLELVEE